jgi:hypothetical protein
MKITIVGGLAIATAIIVVVLLVRHLNPTSGNGPD